MFLLKISIIVTTSILFFSCAEHSDNTAKTNSKKKPIRPMVLEEAVAYKQTILHAQIETIQTSKIITSVSASIESCLPNNSEVTKGQVIAQLNNEVPFKELVEAKRILKRVIEQTLDTMPSWLNGEKAKWIDFTRSLTPSELTPKPLKFNSSIEKKYFNDQGFQYAYDEVVYWDEEMTKYFLVAPANGRLTLKQTNSESVLNKHQTFGTVTSKCNPRLKLLSPLNSNFTDSLDIILPDKKVIGYVIFENGIMKTSKIVTPKNVSIKNGSAVLLTKTK